MKRLAIPVAILVVILIIWLVQSKMETRRITGKVIENFLELDADDINKIVIINNDDTLTFRNEQDNWFLLDSLPRRADSMAVSNMVTSAAEIRVGNVISQNIERQGDFMVDKIMGNLVRFYRDDILLNEVIIGKMASDRTHTYIRKPDSDEVYLAEGLLSYTFKRQKTQWLDKTIFSFVPGSITNVELIYPDRSLKLSAGDSLWYVAKKPYKDSVVADSAKLDAFFQLIGRLHANDFINAADNGLIDFDNFSLKINVSLIDGTTHSIEFAKVNEGNNRIYCRKQGLGEVFVINLSRFGVLKKNFSDFMPGAIKLGK
jgi:hypothetical protein